MHFKSILKSLVSLAAVSFIAGKAQAMPLQLGVMIEPSFEYDKLEPTKKEKDAGLKDLYKNGYMGVDVPVMVQAIFLDGSFKPFVGLGYSFTYLSRDKFDVTASGNKFSLPKGTMKNNNILVQAGVNYMINPHFSLEGFLGYNYVISPKITTDINGKDKDVDLDSVNKFKVGLRGYYTVMDGLDLGLLAGGIFGFSKLKKENRLVKGDSDSNYLMGFQVGLSIRKRFDLMK